MPFKRLKNPASWRRLSIATWGPPNDPTVYGTFPIDFTNGLAYLEKVNRTSANKITVTHLVAKAIALTLQKYPDLNGIIRFKQIYLRESVDIFLQVAIEGTSGGKPDLSGALIRNCDQKSLEAIAGELKNKSCAVREGDDPQFKSSLNLLKIVPDFLLGFILRFITFCMYDLGLPLRKLGIPEDPFGSAMVTSVGMFQVPPGFAPIVPMSRVPLLICIGEVKPRPWVVDGQVVARPILDACTTFDHRFIDGLTGAKMARYFQGILQEPEKFLKKDGIAIEETH